MPPSSFKIKARYSGQLDTLSLKSGYQLTAPISRQSFISEVFNLGIGQSPMPQVLAMRL
jgi:hypothetical protein